MPLTPLMPTARPRLAARAHRATRSLPGRFALLAVVVATLAGAPSARSEEPGAAPAPVVVPLTLDRAASAGLVEVRGESAASYQSVLLVLTSRSKEPVSVDLSGRHLRPTSGSCQRLGLAFPVATVRPKEAAPGTYPVTLAPGERREFRMNSCCLDSGKACPNGKEHFVLDAKPTPPAAEVALRWWVEHPNASQGFVNAAIWQANPALLERGEEDGDHRPLYPQQVRSHRGLLYVVDDGVLTSIDLEGVRRFHATRVLEAIPGDSGLLAIALGSSGLELWRFGETGDPPWMRVFGIDAGTDQVIEGPGGAFVLRRKHEVSFRADRTVAGSAVAIDGRTDAEVERLRLARCGTSGQGAVFVHRQGQGPAGAFNSSQGLHERAPTIEWHDLDLKRGTTKHRKTSWNVADIDGGPAGVFAINRSGRLLRYDGNRAVTVPTERAWSNVIAIGARRLVLRAADHRYVAVDARTGREALLPAGAKDPSVDPITDHVVWIEGDQVHRWTGPSAPVETFPLR